MLSQECCSVTMCILDSSIKRLLYQHYGAWSGNYIHDAPLGPFVESGQ